MGAHINSDGLFQSDKYPTTPAGKVPLSVKDPDAQPLLWAYAQLHRLRDPEFSEDLETALRAAGYVPQVHVCVACAPSMVGETRSEIVPTPPSARCGGPCVKAAR